jgi:predicted CoA-binding protein
MRDVAPILDRGLPARPEDHTVVVLGASPKPARYSNMALRQLLALGYRAIPVHPKVQRIEGTDAVSNLRAVAGPVHTLTLYLGAERSAPLIHDIIRLHPWRVIFNPGSESVALDEHLRRHHIPRVHGCTLVMLRTGQF